MNYFLKMLGGNKVDFSTIKAGTKAEDIQNDKFRSIFKAVDGDGNSVLDEKEVQEFLEKVKSFAEKHKSDSLGDKEFEALKASLGYEFRDMTKEDLLGFIETLAGNKSGQNGAVTNGAKTEYTYENGSKVIINNETGETEYIDKDGNSVTVDKYGRTIKQVRQEGNKVTSTETLENGDIIEKTYDKNTKQAEGVCRDKTGKVLYTFTVDENNVETRITQLSSNHREVKIIDHNSPTRETITRWEDNDGNPVTQHGEPYPSQKVKEEAPEPEVKSTKIVVQNGESIAALAKKFGCSAQEIIDANKDLVKGKKPNQYFLVGEEITIPREISQDKLAGRASRREAQAAYETMVGARAAEQAKAEAARIAKAEAEAKVAEAEAKSAAAKAEGARIADALFDDIDGFGTSKTFGSNIDRINQNNVVEVIEAYRKKSPNESLVEAIMDEWDGLGFAQRRKAVEKIASALVARAKALGIDTFPFERDLKTELNIQQRKIGKADSTKLDAIIEAFVEEIHTAEEVKMEKVKDVAEGTNNSEVRASVTDKSVAKHVVANLKARISAAKEALKNGTASMGWTGWVSDQVSRLWESKNREVLVEADIAKFEAQMERLEKAANGELLDANGKPISFDLAFYEIFGVEFDKDKIISYTQAEEEYQLAAQCSAIYEQAKAVFGGAVDEYKSNGGKYSAEALANLEARVTQMFGDNWQTTVIKGVDYAKASPQDKYKLLVGLADEYLNSSKQQLDAFLEGRSIEDLKRKYDRTYQAAFGVDNDIHQRVTEYVNSQETGVMVTKGLTIAGAVMVTVGTLGTGSPILVGALATMGASAAVEVSDRATNDIDNAQDLSADQIYEICYNAVVDGGIYAATAGLMKLLPGVNAKTLLAIAKQIGAEAGIDTGVSIVGDFLKTGTVTKEGVAMNMIIALLGSSAGAGRMVKGAKSADAPGSAVARPDAPNASTARPDVDAPHGSNRSTGADDVHSSKPNDADVNSGSRRADNSDSADGTRRTEEANGADGSRASEGSRRAEGSDSTDGARRSESAEEASGSRRAENSDSADGARRSEETSNADGANRSENASRTDGASSSETPKNKHYTHDDFQKIDDEIKSLEQEINNLRRAQSAGAGRLPAAEVARLRKILEIPDNVELTPAVLKKYYRQAAVKNHPDRGGSTEKMQDINTANEALNKHLGAKGVDNSAKIAAKEAEIRNLRAKKDAMRAEDLRALQDDINTNIENLQPGGEIHFGRQNSPALGNNLNSRVQIKIKNTGSGYSLENVGMNGVKCQMPDGSVVELQGGSWGIPLNQPGTHKITFPDGTQIEINIPAAKARASAGAAHGAAHNSATAGNAAGAYTGKKYADIAGQEKNPVFGKKHKVVQNPDGSYSKIYPGKDGKISKIKEYDANGKLIREIDGKELDAHPNIDPAYRSTSDEINENEFCRNKGNNGNPVDADYIQASRDLREYYNNAIESGMYSGSYGDYLTALRSSHRIAHAGWSGKHAWYHRVGKGGIDVNPGRFRGAGGMTSNRVSEGQYVESIARRYGDPYRTNGTGKVRLPGIDEDALPYNLHTRHDYPDGKYLDQYFKQMHRTGKEALDLIEQGAPQDMILAKLAEHFQYAANARPFGQINNSLFMNEINTFLAKAGMKTMPHGMLDHAAQRLQPEAFKKYFIDEYKRTAL